MSAPGPDRIVWHKSSHSGDNGACVEVGRSSGGTRVRDSKASCGPELAFPRASWLALVGAVR